MARSKPKRKKKSSRNTFNLNNAILADKKRLIELCEGVGCSITNKLRDSDFVQIYMFTYQQTDVRCHPEHDITPKTTLGIKRLVKTALNTKCHSPIKLANIKISLLDIQLMEGMMYYIEAHIKIDEPTKKELDKDIVYLEEYYGKQIQQDFLVKYSICNFLLFISPPCCNLYTLHYQLNKKLDYKRCRCSSYYYLKKHPAIKEHINVNKHWRPIYKVQQPYFSIEHNDAILKDCIIKTELLKGTYSGTKTDLPVFIQSHAADRMYERLYPLNPAFINKIMHDNLFNNVKTLYYGNHILIEVNVPLGKLGYFLSEVRNDRIVLKTFLLVSNSSTPEGNIFRELTGLNKHDVDYWDLDCLPTFINNNMDKNNHLYTYFEQAGLLHLFKLTPEKLKVVFPEYDFEGELNWDKLENYISNTTDMQELSNTEMDNIDYDTMLK